jgi:glyceraldehyde 3-phosphate dehydrogenase
MTIRVGINGFGRIGRNVFRAAKQSNADLEFVAVNDPGGSVETMAHLLKHDSVLGRLAYDVEVTDGGLVIDGDKVLFFGEPDPRALAWSDLRVDVVLESSGRFTDRDKAAMHVEAGAPFVVVSGPAKGADATFVVGVNDDTFDPAHHQVISNASCTTNCFVPMVKVLDDAFGVERGLMTAVHAYTGGQMLVDGPHKDLRRARAAAINIVPTSTGAARATGLVLTAMQGRLDGQSLRVPVPNGSLTDVTAVLTREASRDEVINAFAMAAESGPLADVLDFSLEPLVSSDIVGSPASCTFDGQLTQVIGTLVKVFGWYDNEWGYSNRLVDILRTVGANADS